MGRNFWNVFWEVLKSSVTLGTPEPHHAVGELAPRGLSDLKEPPCEWSHSAGKVPLHPGPWSTIFIFA